MPRVTIDDIVAVECVSIAGTWNGWQRPLFTKAQLDAVRDSIIKGGGAIYDGDGCEIVNGATVDMSTLDYVQQWDDDLYEVCGWIWDVVEEPTRPEFAAGYCDSCSSWAVCTGMTDAGECERCGINANECECDRSCMTCGGELADK